MEVCNAHPKGSLIEQTTKARLSQAEDGSLQVHFLNPQDEEAVLAGIESNSPFRITKKTKQKVDLERTEIKPEDLATELAQITKSEAGVEWVDISLRDPELKLAVRVQRCGCLCTQQKLTNSRSRNARCSSPESAFLTYS